MREKIKDYLYILPLALIVGIIPLIVRYKKSKLGEVVATYWTRDYNTDFFSYYKSLFFIGTLLLTFLSFYIYIKKENKLRKTLYYIPLAIYLLMIIISTIFSEAKLTSLYGFPDRYEGMAVLIGYVLIVIFAINLINKQRQIKLILTFLIVTAVVIGILGLYQFYGLDFFQSAIGKKLILPSENYANLADKLDFRFGHNNIIYATFYNPNYAGSYFAMLFMLTFVLYFFSNKRDYSVLLGAINLLMFANWLGSLSRAGILGVLFSSFILIFLLGKELIKKWKKILVILIAFIIVFTAMDMSTDNKLRKEFFSLGVETELALKGEVADIKDISYEDNTFKFITEKNALYLNFDENDELVFKDGNNNKLNYYLDNEKEIKDDKDFIYLEDEIYSNYKFRIINNKKNENQVLEFYYNEKQLNLLVDKYKNFWMIGMRGNVYPIKDVESWGFEGKESLASGRGYIWSRSLPLLKDTIIKGYGPDTYAIYFSQDDVIGKFKAFRNTAKIVDKPHNMYLQIAINTGLISLVAVLALFTIYFFRNIIIYLKSDYNYCYEKNGLAIFTSIIAYLVAGFFNDSIVSVAPVFWTLLGIGIMIELKIKGYDKV
ncbi:MAG: O-antigen ligase family protein [Candidatus Woesearchaeota archaeon]